MRTKKLSVFFIVGGLLLITAALCLAAYNLHEDTEAASSVSHVLQEIRQEETLPDTNDLILETSKPEAATGEQPLVVPGYMRDPHMEMPAKEIDGETYIGVLDIPALDLSLPVISQWSYPRLKVAPCRYQGSAYLDDLIIAAHNYRSHFGTLVDIKIGDAVYFTDMDSHVFVYEVLEVETLGGSDVESMVSGDWDLTLFTCTVGGKTRVTVRCERME